MTLDEFFAIGERVTIGSHRFDAEAIKAFARQYDPQRFHVDEEAARHSVFGALCASGWHTAAVWMKCNVAHGPTRAWMGEGPAPVFGPSPGFENLRWTKPVYAGETVTYTRTATGLAPSPGRPGWYILSLYGDGHDSTGAKVLEFDSRVLIDGRGN